MVSQMDVFLQNETKSFVEMLFTVVDTKEYINPPAVKVGSVLFLGRTYLMLLQDDNGHDASKEEAAGPKIEADSTTPIREPEKMEKVTDGTKCEMGSQFKFHALSQFSQGTRFLGRAAQAAFFTTKGPKACLPSRAKGFKRLWTQV